MRQQHARWETSLDEAIRASILIAAQHPDAHEALIVGRPARLLALTGVIAGTPAPKGCACARDAPFHGNGPGHPQELRCGTRT